MLPEKQYIEERFFLIGWIYCGVIEDENGQRPASHDTLGEAVEFIVEQINTVDEQIAQGERSPDNGLDPRDFRVTDNKTGGWYNFAYSETPNVLLVTGPDGQPRAHLEYTDNG